MGADVYALLLESSPKIVDLNKVFIKAGLPELITSLPKKSRVGVKVLLPNTANINYVPPTLIRNVLGFVNSLDHPAVPIDTLDVLDDGLETLARVNEVGYSFQTLQTPFMIADNITGYNFFEVFVQGDYLPRIELGTEFKDVQMLICLTHVTGDPFYGYFGSISHISSRSVTKEFKKKKLLANLRLEIDERRCNGCNLCSKICPVGAINTDALKIDANTCIKCGYCIILCPTRAIMLEESSRKMFIGKSLDVVKGIKRVFDERMFFVNILMNVIPYPDNMPFSSKPIVEDIGILGSKDPVAVDKASLDLIIKQCKYNAFEDLYGVDPNEMLVLAERDKIGRTKYNLVEV